MGGMGFISAHHAQILHNNSLINLHTLEAARLNGVKRYLYTSSACVYPEYLQTDANVTPLKEEDAYPAQPQDAYGWEKLITERLCPHYREDYGIETRIVRFHNIFGPLGTWDGGREKAPAAMCRKVAIAKLTGDPRSRSGATASRPARSATSTTASRASTRLMRSDYRRAAQSRPGRHGHHQPARGHGRRIAGVEIVKRHMPGPQGVRGRNSDNTRLRAGARLGAARSRSRTASAQTYRGSRIRSSSAAPRPPKSVVFSR